eukprot:TRINITY_DN8041_c0_g1_i1.p1 TRINITY_DN8041_c0_g1~~TRINITY_DN8041_c0_g1_i1.p1  ORF type:complete len:102 (-),score=11.42 TRINITY_DN8041_c0_g1_i1:638-943(-)
MIYPEIFLIEWGGGGVPEAVKITKKRKKNHHISLTKRPPVPKCTQKCASQLMSTVMVVGTLIGDEKTKRRRKIAGSLPSTSQIEEKKKRKERKRKKTPFLQ